MLVYIPLVKRESRAMSNVDERRASNSSTWHQGRCVSDLINHSWSSELNPVGLGVMSEE